MKMLTLMNGLTCNCHPDSRGMRFNLSQSYLDHWGQPQILMKQGNGIYQGQLSSFLAFGWDFSEQNAIDRTVRIFRRMKYYLGVSSYGQIYGVF